MSVSVERLRRWMLVGAALLVAVIAAFLLYAHHLQKSLGANVKRDLHNLGLDIVAETNDFTISQSAGEGGKTLYTIHASKEIQHKNGQITLRDVGITLYGRKHDREDHISGSEFQYDQTAGTVTAEGEVHIDLQAPVAPGKPRPAPAADGTDPNVIHVKTHGLIFWQKMGMAATQQYLEFQVKGIAGSAVGAEYSSDTGLLVLQSQVKAAGMANGRPVQLAAAHAELNRSAERAVLRQASYVSLRPGRSSPEKASADEAIVLLTPEGTPRHIDASGDVTLEPDSGRTVRSAKMAVDLDPAGQPRNLHAFGGVRYTGDEPLRKGAGSAEDARVWFDQHGIAQRMVSTGKVQLTQRSHSSAAEPWATRSLSGNVVDAAFAPVPGSKQVAVSDVLATGAARMVTETTAAQKPGAKPTAPVTTTTTLTSNRIDAKLLGNPDGLAHLHGEGRAEVQQAGSDGAQQDDRGDSMDVVFRQQPRQGAKQPEHGAKQPEQGAKQSANSSDALASLVSASLQGHVTMAETAARKPGDTRPPAISHGSASRVDYDAAQDRVTLTRNAQWASQGRTFWADRISTDRVSGDAEAQGSVKTTLLKEGAPSTAEPTHVVADHARLHQATQTAEFFGSSTVPARLWQGGSQVEAPILVLEQMQQRLTARGDGPGLPVHAVFIGTEASIGKKKTSVVRVASRELVYSDGPRLGNFTGGVQVESSDGQMTAQRADVWLQPAGTPQTPQTPQPGAKPSAPAASSMFGGGSVDHMIASGRVRLTQPGRRGAGEQLVYTAADQKFVLTGTPADPPTLTDQRGATTGASLIFHAGDDSVEISGGPAGDASREVHTETRVKPRTRQQ